MPLSSAQRAVMAVIAANRHPGSHVGGGSVINLDGQRVSHDIDIFHDLSGHAERICLLADTVAKDEEALLRAGFALNWTARHPELYRAIISGLGEATLLEWIIDSDYRFFDASPDPIFGYRLHLFDIATNKVLAAASRKEPRDVVDLVYLHRHGLPLAGAIWAAPAKDPGCTPESLIADIRRNSIYRQDDYDRLLSYPPIDAGDISRAFKAILMEAEIFVASMPSGFDGLAFMRDGKIAEPDPLRLSEYDCLAARRHAHWPTSPEIASQMILAENGKSV